MRNVDNLISIFEEVVELNLLIIDCDATILYRLLVVFRRICFEFFDKSGE